MRSGTYFLHWYYDKPYSYLAVWQHAHPRDKWRLVRRTCLPAGAPSFVNSQIPETEWLRPGSHTGPILIFTQSYFSSFAIFPRGFGGPAHLWSGGSGDAGWNCSFYRLGPPDAQGFRILRGRYQWDTMDHGTTTDWNRYWTGTGWENKGPETTTEW